MQDGIVEDAPFTVVLQRLCLAALVRNLALVQVTAKIEGVLHIEESGLTVKHRLVNVYQGIFHKFSIRTSTIYSTRIPDCSLLLEPRDNDLL